MSQATISTEPYLNSNLFSGYYLDNRIDELDAWDCDEQAQEAFDELRELWDLEGDLVASYNEDELLDSWIGEVLDVLGFGTLSETTLPDSAGYNDRLLFESDDTRRDAAMMKKDGNANGMYGLASAVLEAKQWNADFTERFNEDRSYRDASHQIKYYLERTPERLQWGVLTDGRKWRLYGTKDYATETYYEVDLPDLLASGDLEAFKYFYVFFRPAAFRETAGTSFLDTVWNESETAAQELGEDLQDNVFTALRVLGEGFVETNDLDIDPDDEQEREKLKEQSLVLLYRLMFVLYAESRHLINPDDPDAEDDYRENFSLDQLRLTVHEKIESGDSFDDFSEHATSMWSRLRDLFRLVDTGEDSLGIPPYNGGLFDDDNHSFLADHQVTDRYLAEVIYRLGTTETEDGSFVLADYADLDTRHLGTIYEGLLEHEFRIASEQYAAVASDGGQVWKPATEVSVADSVETVERGELYVVNDDGERKATGAYYTPDYVVTYIVEETVDPLLSDIDSDLQADGLEASDREYFMRFWQRVLDLKVLDPAMGSGHFLTKATGYLTEQVMEVVREQEIQSYDEQDLRREIAKECIYGVDLNGMAVELAKLSMWLETLAADQPLAFLDHHLKDGNSLVGSDITEVLSNGSEENGGQLTLTQAFAQVRERTVEHVMDLMEELLAIDNETLDDIKSMEEIYDEIRADPLYKRLFEMANVHTAERFGLDVPEDAYEEMAQAIENDSEWAEVQDKDWFYSAQVTADGEDFFHWELEFPEVFFGGEGAMREDAGFDAVVGNPPYVNMDRVPQNLSSHLREIYPNIQKGQSDLLYFFVIGGSHLLKPTGRLGYIVARYFMGAHFAKGFRQFIQKNCKLDHILDFKNYAVFRGVGTKTCLLFLENDHHVASANGDKFTYSSINRRTPTPDTVSAGLGNIKKSPIFETTENIHSELSEERWVFPTNSEKELIEKTDSQSWSLGDIVRVGMGMQTGANNVFEVTEEEIEEHGIEKEVLRKIVSNQEIHRYTIEFNDRYWIYTHPYANIEDRFPNAISYLRDHYTELQDRIAIERGDCEWHEFSYPRHTKYYDNPKIITPFIAPYNRFGLDTEGSIYSSTDSQVIFATDETPVSLEYLIVLLNSKLLNWRYQYLGKLKDYRYEYSKDAIERIPIYNIDKNLQTIQSKTVSKIGDYLSGVKNGEEKSTSSQDLSEIFKKMVRTIIGNKSKILNLNLTLQDHLGSYTDGPTLSEIGFTQPPEGSADSILNETTEQKPNLRVGRPEIVRESSTSVEIRLTARYKPDDENAHETDQWGYTETEPLPALKISDLTETEVDLIEAFVPVAVDEAGGFADFRETATKTNSLVDRLRKLTLPRVDDVREGLADYIETKKRAEELEEKIERTDDLIDEIVYELYGLTDEEIAIVEEAVNE